MHIMKYKILIILLLLILPINVFAASAPDLDKNYTIQSVSINLSSIGIANYYKDHDSFPLYQATDTNLFYHIYSLNIDDRTSDQSLSVSNENSMYSSKSELISAVLANAVKFNSANTEDIGVLTGDSINNALKTQAIQMVATQVIIWEITNGERSSFDAASSNSPLYKNFVLRNKQNSSNSGLISLYDAYVSLISDIKTSASGMNSNSKEKPYKLYYNVSNNKYQNIISAIDFDELYRTYTIKNDTPIVLKSNVNGLMASVTPANYFTDVKAINISKKEGSTNTSLEKFYYFTTKDGSSPYVLATKAQKVKDKLYFTCAQGNFRLMTLEGGGSTVTGATYNIKDANGNVLKFNKTSNSFNYDASSDSAIEELKVDGSNSYTINEVPDGEYSIVQTAVPDGVSFVEDEEERTVKIKIDDGNFYVYNKVLMKYEKNQMRIVKFTNYISKVYIIESDNNDLGNNDYTIKNNKNEFTSFLKNRKKVYNYSSATAELVLGSSLYLENNKRLTIYGLPADSYTVHSSYSNSDRHFIIKNNTTYGDSIIISFDNKAGEILFYSTNEKGALIDGGMFSLQKVNGEETEDIALTYDSSTDTYKIDPDGEEYTFVPKKGKTKITGTTAGQTYRIVELSPPDGYQLFDTTVSYVDVTMDSSNFAESTPYIINKQIVAESDISSSSELILSIRTGNDIVKYGAIAGGVVIVLSILLLLRKKLSKKKKKHRKKI